MYSLHFGVSYTFSAAISTAFADWGELLEPVDKTRSSRHPSWQLGLTVEATCHECSVKHVF